MKKKYTFQNTIAFETRYKNSRWNNIPRDEILPKPISDKSQILHTWTKQSPPHGCISRMVLFPPRLSGHFTVTCYTPRLTIRWHRGRWSPRFLSKCWKCWMKAKLISLEIAQNRLRSWPFILSFPLPLERRIFIRATWTICV